MECISLFLFIFINKANLVLNAQVYLVPFIFTEAPLDQTLGHALEEESAATELISNEELANVTAPTCWEMIKAGSAENYSVSVFIF